MKKPDQQGEKRERVRQCVSCRRLRNKAEMIRVIRKPDGTVAVDPTGKMNGRGAYLCKDDPECLKKAIQKKIIDRSLNVPIPADVAEKLLKWAEEGDHETV